MQAASSPIWFRSRALWFAWILTVLLICLGLFQNTPTLLGDSRAEVFGHAWVQWWHMEALPDWPSGTPLALSSSNWPVVDPATTLISSFLGLLIGSTASWNVLFILGISLSFWGGAFLCQRAGGSPLVGGVGLSLSPIFLGSLSSGLTEDLALGLLAFSFGFLVYPRNRRDRILGGLLLGVTVWCGLYLAFMGALVALCLGIRALLQKEEVVAWLIAGAVALVVGLPALFVFGERLLGEGHNAGVVPMPAFDEFWRLNSVQSSDAAAFFAIGQQEIPEDAVMRMHPTYIGWVLLLCAFRAGRSLWWWVFGVALILACGPSFRVAGHATGVDNPVFQLFSYIPFAEQLNHSARLMLMGQLALVILASRGVSQWTRPPLWIAIGVVAEVLWVSPAPLPLPTTDARIDAVFAQIPPGEGRILVLPIGGPGINPQKSLYEQRAHARVLALNPNKPGGLWRSKKGPKKGLEIQTTDWLCSLALDKPHPRPERIDVSRFLNSDVDTIVVRDAWVEQVELGMGNPHIRAQGGAIWDLTRLSSDAGGTP